MIVKIMFTSGYTVVKEVDNIKYNNEADGMSVYGYSGYAKQIEIYERGILISSIKSLSERIE